MIKNTSIHVPCNVLKNMECVSLIARLSSNTKVGPPAFAKAKIQRKHKYLTVKFILVIIYSFATRHDQCYRAKARREFSSRLNGQQNLK